MPPDPILKELGNIPMLKRILAEHEAILLPSRETEQTSMSLVGDVEIRRAWADSIPDDASNLIAYLEHFTSTKNPQPLKTVTDPMASQAVMKGLYRQVSVIKTKHLYPDGGSVHRNVIIQVLRKGYIEGLLLADGSLDWSEARLVESKQLHAGATGYDTGSENYLTVEWPNVSPYRAKTIVDQINGLAVSGFGPVVKGETYDTGYHRLHCGSRIEDDGSATIRLFLAHPEFTLYAFSNWLSKTEKDVFYFWNVPKELAQPLLELYRGKGKSATCNYNTNQALVDIIIYETNFRAELYLDVVAKNNCDAIMYADYYWGVEDPEAYTINTAPRGWTYERRISPQADGYDIIIFRTQSQHRAYDTRWASYSTLVEVSQYQQLGAPGEVHIPDVTGVGAGGIYEVNVRPRDDCSLDIMTNYERGKRVDLIGRRVRSSYVELADRDRYWNIATAVQADEDAIGYIYDASNDLNRFGLYDASHSIRTAREQTVPATAISDNALASATRSQSVNVGDPIAADSFNIAGYIYEATSSLNDFGLYDGGKVKRTAKPVTVGVKRTRNGVLASVDTNILHNAVNAAEASDAEAGWIYDARNLYNDFGRYDSVTSTTTANAVPFVNKRVEARVDQELYEDVYQNAADPFDTPPAAAGHIYDVQNSINEFGLYDIRQRRRNATPKSYSSIIMQSELSTASGLFYRNSSSILNAPSASVGTIYQANSALNAFGYYDGRITSTDSTEKELYTTWPHRYGTAALRVMKNQKAFPTAEVAALTNAMVNSVGPSFNQDGTYDVAISETPHAWGALNTEKIYHWRYKTTAQSKSLDVYVYLNTDLDYIEDWLEETSATNMSGTTIHHLGGNRWQGVKVLEVA